MYKYLGLEGFARVHMHVLLENLALQLTQGNLILQQVSQLSMLWLMKLDTISG